MLFRPLVAIPMGDPAGIGPEIIIKALQNKDIYNICKPVVIGNKNFLEKTADTIKCQIKLNIIDTPWQGKYEYGTIDLISLDNIDIETMKFGEVQPEAGKAAFEYIVKTIELANAGSINAVATTPINKKAINEANINFIGHTEIFGDMTNTKDPLTMFQVHNMKVFFLSRHVSLKEACDMVRKDRLLNYIIRCDDALKKLGIEKRLIAVAGLNPHNGECGLFGNEEKEIEAAVAEAKKEGIKVVGPIPSDCVFYQALKGRYEAVLSLYHDQGHIATKMVDFEKTISLTIGLPFLRTSVDHGTAFDIAGKGIASSVSMEEAIKLAALYSVTYQNY